MGKELTRHTHRHQHRIDHPHAFGFYSWREHTHEHGHTGKVAGSYGDGSIHRDHRHTTEQRRELRP